MTSVRWDNGEYYAKKNRRAFRRFDNLLNKEFDRLEDGAELDIESAQKLDMLNKGRLSNVHSNVKVAEALYITPKINRLQKLFDMIPEELLAPYHEKWKKQFPKIDERQDLESKV